MYSWIGMHLWYSGRKKTYLKFSSQKNLVVADTNAAWLQRKEKKLISNEIPKERTLWVLLFKIWLQQSTSLQEISRHEVIDFERAVLGCLLICWCVCWGVWLHVREVLRVCLRKRERERERQFFGEPTRTEKERISQRWLAGCGCLIQKSISFLFCFKNLFDKRTSKESFRENGREPILFVFLKITSSNWKWMICVAPLVTPSLPHTRSLTL